MKDLLLFKFQLREGETPYASYGEYCLISSADFESSPTPETIKTFIDYYVPKEDLEGANPVNLFYYHRDGDYFMDYYPSDSLKNLFKDFDLDKLNHGYFIYAGCYPPESLTIFNEEENQGILVDKNTGEPLYIEA